MGPTAAGWTIMILSIGSVCALTAFCCYRLIFPLTIPPDENGGEVHIPFDP
jgi:hypothetical protein